MNVLHPAIQTEDINHEGRHSYSFYIVISISNVITSVFPTNGPYSGTFSFFDPIVSSWGV